VLALIGRLLRVIIFLLFDQFLLTFKYLRQVIPFGLAALHLLMVLHFCPGERMLC
jgi:hypothetical protein